MSILCTLKNLNLSFGNRTLFKDAIFSLGHGEKIGLLGLNGHGKSSLFKILAGELIPDTKEKPFLFDKARGEKDPSLKYSVFLVPQELPLEKDDPVTIRNYFYRFHPRLFKIQKEINQINGLLEDQSGQEEIEKLLLRQKDLMEEMERNRGWEIISLYESYLKYFGPFDLDRPVRELSGGEQKKTLLSLGLSSPANLVLWDEPTNHLDLQAIKKFELEMSSVKNAYVLISHDRYLLSKLTKKIFHIQNGLIKSFEGGYQDYLSFLKSEEEGRINLLARLKNGLKRETEWMRQGIKARGCRNKGRVENFLQLKERVHAIKLNAKKEMDLCISHSGRKSKQLVELIEVEMKFSSRQLFKDLSLSIQKGDKIGLLGANGTGKTTLVNLIAGNIDPSSGKIKRADNLITKIFTQKREELNPNDTPFELLGKGSDFISLPNGKRTHVGAWFESFLFKKEDLKRPLKTFSGGERNRLQMALNFTCFGDLWIFDEPTNDLDLETLGILEKKLVEFKGSLILISHDRAFLSNITNKIWLLDEGIVENFDGGYGQVEDFLEALAMEKQILAEETKIPKSPPKKAAKKKVKLSFKEKKLMEELKENIQQMEEDLLLIQEKVETFDYSQMDEDRSKKLAHLHSRQKDLEDKLYKAYEEWENWEDRSS